MGPAGSTVLRDMLVSGPGEVVNSIDITPVPVVWDVLRGKDFVWEWHGDPGWGWGLWSDDLISEEKSVFWFFLGLLGFKAWEEIFNFFLDWFLGGNTFSTFSSWLGPSVDWCSKSAIALDSNIVDASNDSEKSVFTEVLTPGISDFPEFDTVFDTISDDGYVMNDIGIVGHVVENTSGIIFKCVRDGNTTSNGTSLVDLIHNGLFVLRNGVVVSSDMTVLIHSVDVVLIGNPAALVGGAVSADDVVGALDSGVVTTSLIVGAGLIGDVMVVHPLKSRVWVSTVAAVVIGPVVT